MKGQKFTERAHASLVRMRASDWFKVLFICGVVQLLAAVFLFAPYSLYPDSATYYNFSKNIFLGEIDPIRTPLYPYIIKLLKIFGEGHLFLFIVAFQKIVSFIGIYIFLKLAKQMYRSEKVAAVAAIVYGTSPFVFTWDHCILTESLSITGGVCFLALLYAVLQKPDWRRIVLLNFFAFILVMLRPSFLSTYAVLFVFWIMYGFQPGRSWKYWLWIPSFVFSLLLLAGYCRQNMIMNGSFELSTVAMFDQLGSVYRCGSYRAGGDEAIIRALDQDTSTCHERIFYDFPRNRINTFIKNSIRNKPLEFLKFTGSKFRVIWQSPIGTVYSRYKTPIASVLVFGYGLLFPMSIVLPLLLLDLILAVYLFRKRDARGIIKIGYVLIIFGQICTSALGAQEEWTRLCAPCLPAIFIMLFYWIDIMRHSLKHVRVLDYFDD